MQCDVYCEVQCTTASLRHGPWSQVGQPEVPRQQGAAEWESLAGELFNRHSVQAIQYVHSQVAYLAEVDVYNAEL